MSRNFNHRYGPPTFEYSMGGVVSMVGGVGISTGNGNNPIYAGFVDLDGTLLTTDHKILPSTVGYVRKAITERDVNIILVSGRAPASMKKYIDEIGIEDPIYIAHHGARIENDGVTIPNGERPINEQDARNVIGAYNSLEGLGGKTELLFFHGNVVPHIKSESQTLREYKERNPNLEYFSLRGDATIDDYFGRGLPDKLVVLARSSDLASQLKEELGRILKGNLENLEMMITNGNYLEIIDRNATKGSAVKTVLDYLRGMPPKNAIAIGDGETDLTMASQARVRLYLLSNAPQNVKDKAREMKTVTLVDRSNMEDGVGWVIANFVLKEDYQNVKK